MYCQIEEVHVGGAKVYGRITRETPDRRSQVTKQPNPVCYTWTVARLKPLSTKMVLNRVWTGFVKLLQSMPAWVTSNIAAHLA